MKYSIIAGLHEEGADQVDMREDEIPVSQRSDVVRHLPHNAYFIC